MTQTIESILKTTSGHKEAADGKNDKIVVDVLEGHLN